MKGQKLWVRPATPADQAEVAAFLAAEHLPPLPPGTILLLGKLVGTLVACAAWSLSGSTLELECLCVASDLRRKRIGRAMVSEIEKLAARMHSDSVVARRDSAVAGYLLSRGFEERGGRVVKTIRNHD